MHNDVLTSNPSADAHLWLIPCSPITSDSNSDKSGFHHLWNFYLIVQFQNKWRASSELLTHTPREAILSARVWCLCWVPFFFSFTDSIHFQSYLDRSKPWIILLTILWQSWKISSSLCIRCSFSPPLIHPCSSFNLELHFIFVYL